MNKDELKKFAVEARRDLLKKVSLKAEQYGITKEDQTLRFEEKYGELVINGRSYPMTIKNTLKTMESKLKKVGYEQFIEEVAYTWFNRITAIRYMEVNGHLPERVNVLSSTSGKTEPDIIFFYETMSLDIKKDEIRRLLNEEETNQAYRKLFVAQCNALNKVMPFLFERIEDYTELLLPDYLLDQESVISRITKEVSEDNFYEIEEDGTKKDNVEILGWLYQYYMSEKKEKVGGLKNSAVKKEDLPVVTQLFTPKWIVQYMVQNSLGKLYDEKYEDNNLSKNWEYYLKHEENHHLYPEFDSLEEIKILDPACGSGHILLYAFDMLYDMYQEAGYPSRNIPQLILENNLYGLDIDKRAQQIANFALLMKAVEKQPRLLSRLNRNKDFVKTNVYEIVDADQSLSEEAINYLTENNEEKNKIKELINQFGNGKQFGSLIVPLDLPYASFVEKLFALEDEPKDLIEGVYAREIKEKLLPVLLQGQLLNQKYDVILTNPPYHSKYNSQLKNFMEKNYKKYKVNLYSAFINITTYMLKENGYSGLMTPFTWMFNTYQENLRNDILSNKSISSLIELEYSAFKEATVPICTFVIQNQTSNTEGVYIELSDFKGSQSTKVKEAVNNSNIDFKYLAKSNLFRELPGSPIAYWVTEELLKTFKLDSSLGDYGEAREGLTTGDNDRFLRLWHEVNFSKVNFNIQNKDEASKLSIKWVPYQKGGNFKRWYGNTNYVVNWENNGYEIKNNKTKEGRVRSHNYNENYIFRKGITWTGLSSGLFGARMSPTGFLFDSKGKMFFCNNDDDLNYILGFMNSKVFQNLIDCLSPTQDYSNGYVSKVPFEHDSKVKSIINHYVEKCVQISKTNWDLYEESWAFKSHPLLAGHNLKVAFEEWKLYTEKEQSALRNLEKDINKIFTEQYNLENIIDSHVEPSSVKIRLAKREEEAKSFLSYFIGSLTGRYSLDVEGLAYAGGNFEDEKYISFEPNKGGLVQITEKNYFKNDIIVQLKEFLVVAFSEEMVNENIKWLAESLKMKKNESPEERLRRYFLDDFFKDHCKAYQKHPIYWLVDSGKQNGLRTLIYMHRYQPDTMATIRFEHLQEIQSKYQNEIEMLDLRLSNPNISASDRRNLEKSKESYQKKIEELQEFDKKLAVYANDPIDIDLDDGVKVNYAKFGDVLAKIK